MRRRTLLPLVLFVSLAAAPSWAVSFRITSTTVAPGETSATVYFLIDPEGASIDGFQFGVNADGGATVTGIDNNGDWMDIVTVGETGQPNTIDVTGDGTGRAVEIDIDAANVFKLEGLPELYALSINVNFPALADGSIINLTFDSTLGTPDIETGYFVGPTLMTDMTLTNGTITASDTDLDFANAAGDVFTASSWNPNELPAADKDLFVRNGGTGTGTGGTLAASNLQLGYGAAGPGTGSLVLSGTDLIVETDIYIGAVESEDYGSPISGTENYSGSLTVTNTDLVEVFDFFVGVAVAAPNANVTAAGTVVFDQVERVHILEDWEVAEIRGDSDLANVTADLSADLRVTNVDTLVIGEDFELSRSQNDTDGAPATIVADSTSLFENIDEFLIGEDLEYAEAGTCDASSTGDADFTMSATTTFRNIGRFLVAEDIELIDRGCSSPADKTASANAAFENIESFEVGEDFEFPWFSMDGSGTVDLDGDLFLTNVDSLFVREDLDLGLVSHNDDATGVLTLDQESTFEDVDEIEVGDRIRVGVITQCCDGPFGPASITTNTTVSIANSAITAGVEIQVGSIEGPDGGDRGGPAQVSTTTSLTLLSSAASTPSLEVGAITNGGFGTATALLDTNGYLSANLFNLGPDGTLFLRITGETVASPDTVGLPTQALAQFGNATLDGTVVVSLDFVPDPGLQVFDVMEIGVTSGARGPAPTLILEDLPAGVDLESFEFVQEGGGMVLRLGVIGPDLLEVPTMNTVALGIFGAILALLALTVVRRTQ